MAGWQVTCPECNGEKGWANVDGVWVECFVCKGQGSVDEDKLTEPDLDEDD